MFEDFGQDHQVGLGTLNPTFPVQRVIQVEGEVGRGLVTDAEREMASPTLFRVEAQRDDGISWKCLTQQFGKE